MRSIQQANVLLLLATLAVAGCTSVQAGLRSAAKRDFAGLSRAPDADRIAADDDAKRAGDPPDATAALHLLTGADHAPGFRRGCTKLDLAR